MVHERNQPSPAASPTVTSMQPPVVIPSVYNRRKRSHSRHGSVSSASERPEVMNGFDISLSDEQNGADAESHRSTLRPPPKPYAVSNQNLVPPSPRGSRKPTEPRNGSPARSNTRARSPFLSPDRSGPHSPDFRRGRPSPYTTQPFPRAPQPSPERSRTVCDDRPFSGAPGTPPHGRSGSDGAAEWERPEVHGDARVDERTTSKWKSATSAKDIEANKITQEPWVLVEKAQETRLQRVAREHKSSPRFPPSNSTTLSRSHAIPHMSRQQHPTTPGGDREPRGSGRQAVPHGWAVQWKPATGDPSSPVPLYNLKMAKSMDNLRDKSVGSPSQGRSRFGPAPPLPSTPPSGNSMQSRDGTPTSQTMNGDTAGSASQRETISPPNDPPKPQAEPSRPRLRASPTNSRPIRPLPQQTSGQPVPDVAVTATLSQPRLPFPQSPPSGLSTPTSSTSTLLPAQSDTVSRPRSVFDEESTPLPAPLHARLPRQVDSSVFSEPLQESDMLRSPLPPPPGPRFPPRQLPPPLSREDSAPLTTTRALPIPCRPPAMDDRSADARSGSLIDVSSTPTNRTSPRSPVSPRSPWMDTRERFGNAISTADVPWSHGQSQDLIDFNKPAEQTIMQDDNTLRAIQHLLDGQSSSEEATVIMKPKTTYVLPPIPPPPPLQTIRNIGYVPPPPPLPKPSPAPIPVTPTQSNNSIYSPAPLTPDSQPSDQDGSDSEAGTLWQKPMIEEDILAERPKSASRGPPLTVKIDGQFGGSTAPVSQMKSSSSSGGMTLIPNNFPPPPKHPPPSPPLPQWGGRTPTRTLLKEQPKSEGTFQDSWASRPNPEEVLDRLEDFFPDYDLDKPVIEASSGGTSPTAAENPPAPLPYNGKSADKRSRHKKSIRVVAEEHNLRRDRTSRIQASSAANVFRKRSTKLWDSRVEEVTPGQISSGMPSIPDSPSATGPGTPAPKRPFLSILAIPCAVAHITSAAIFKWVRGELIGKGNFGRVYLALNATTGEMIAVKQVEIPRTASDKNDTRQVTVVEALKLESETLKDLDHPNIVQYLGFEETPNFLSM